MQPKVWPKCCIVGDMPGWDEKQDETRMCEIHRFWFPKFRLNNKLQQLWTVDKWKVSELSALIGRFVIVAALKCGAHLCWPGSSWPGSLSVTWPGALKTSAFEWDTLCEARQLKCVKMSHTGGWVVRISLGRICISAAEYKHLKQVYQTIQQVHNQVQVWSDHRSMLCPLRECKILWCEHESVPCTTRVA